MVIRKRWLVLVVLGLVGVMKDTRPKSPKSAAKKPEQIGPYLTAVDMENAQACDILDIPREDPTTGASCDQYWYIIDVYVPARMAILERVHPGFSRVPQPVTFDELRERKARLIKKNELEYDEAVMNPRRETVA